MKEFRFNEAKNKLLKSKRYVRFEDVIDKIKSDKNTRAIKNPNKVRYPRQQMFLVKIKNRIYVVPFIEEKDYILLKTIYPSEKYTKKLLKFKK